MQKNILWSADLTDERDKMLYESWQVKSNLTKC
jgi:hypothetical protein